MDLPPLCALLPAFRFLLGFAIAAREAEGLRIGLDVLATFRQGNPMIPNPATRQQNEATRRTVRLGGE